MRVAVTGATGFLGRYIVHHLAERGHPCRCWYRPGSDRGGFDEIRNLIEWVPGELAVADETRRSSSVESGVDSMRALMIGADAVVHAALYRPGSAFRGGEGDLCVFVERNVLGTIRLIETARAAGIGRFVFISTCAVHEIILDDRKLDEAHPLWATSHYGAHKAAIEQFVHSYGHGEGYDICALRPTGIYGITRPVENSKWYDLVQSVRRGEPVSSSRGGKEVHASDVAKAVEILLHAEGIAGQAYNCFDEYIAHQEVAAIARQITGSDSTIDEVNKGPKHLIDTTKLRALGMTFGGRPLLVATVREMLNIAG